jgi:hypothetical protein
MDGVLAAYRQAFPTAVTEMGEAGHDTVTGIRGVPGTVFLPGYGEEYALRASFLAAVAASFGVARSHLQPVLRHVHHLPAAAGTLSRATRDRAPRVQAVRQSPQPKQSAACTWTRPASGS